MLVELRLPTSRLNKLGFERRLPAEESQRSIPTKDKAGEFNRKSRERKDPGDEKLVCYRANKEDVIRKRETESLCLGASF